MSETPTPVHATVPDQPELSMPLRKKQPLLILLFIILLVFVGSSVVTATKKAGPLKSQLTARPAMANPQQVNSFEAQQEQVAKKDQEEQQQRAATAALLTALQDPNMPGPESQNAPPMTRRNGQHSMVLAIRLPRRRRRRCRSARLRPNRRSWRVTSNVRTLLLATPSPLISRILLRKPRR